MDAIQKIDAFANDTVLLLGLSFAAALLAALFHAFNAKRTGGFNVVVLVVGVCLSGIVGYYLQQWLRDYLLITNRQAVQFGRFSRQLYGLCDIASIGALLAASALGGAATAFLGIRRSAAGEVTRGTQIASSKRWQSDTRKARIKHGPLITIAGCGVKRDDEIKHFAVFGTTGTGKSVAIREMLMGAQARGDIILNPFDARSAAWDMMAEAPSDFAADQLAESLIPDPGGSADTSWAARARVLLSAILRRGRYAGIDIAEVFRLFAIAPREELQILLQGTAAEPFLADGAVKLFDNVRSSTGSALNALEYVAHAGHEPFSITKWAASDSKAWVFLPYRADQIAALKSLIGPWMRLAIMSTMSRAEGDEQPTWFVADELDAIGKMQSLDDALQRVRKFGGRCVLGFQTIGKVRAIYGDGIAAALVENCGTRLVLRCAGGDRNSTAAFASSLIGQQSYLKESTNQGQHSKGSSSSGSSLTTVTEDAVLPSQIEQLADLNGYLKVPSVTAWHTVTVPFVDMPKRAKSFVAVD